MSNEKKPRAKRRNFAEERTRLITFCQLSIEILSDVKATEPIANMPASSNYGQGRIDAFKAVLRQMGEGVE